MVCRLVLAFVAMVGAVSSQVVGAQGNPPAQAGSATAVPWAVRTLARGVVIAADDLVGAMPSDAAPVGWVTRRVIREGEPLRTPAIGRAPVVRSGAAVTARLPSVRVQITRDAKVLTDGGPGDTVFVRLDRHATVSAVVLDSATVILLRRSPH
jgi:flagella basal body P-ring formation protein FlgA